MTEMWLPFFYNKRKGRHIFLTVFPIEAVEYKTRHDHPKGGYA